MIETTSEHSFDSISTSLLKLTKGEVSSCELVELAINNINKFDTHTNAVVYKDFDAAISAAKNSDKQRKNKAKLGPLHGIPITIKEAFDVCGQPTTWGVPKFKNNIAQRDSLIVEKLKDAGAILIGKTNVPFMLSDWQTFNDIYGTTNNPWDLSRSPGGSSGGAAAAVASGYVPAEIGSDIGGSIRGPAHYCGIYGHKSSYGLVPMDGHTLPGIDIDLDLIVAGPLARHANDLRRVLNIIKGPSRINSPAWDVNLPERPRSHLSNFRVAIFCEEKNCSVDNEILEKLLAVGAFLEENGAKVSYDEKPDIDFFSAHDNYLRTLRGTTGALMEDTDYLIAQKEVKRLNDTDNSYWAYVNRGATQDYRSFFALKRRQHFLRDAWHSFFKDWDIFLCPIAASTAIRHDQKRHRKDRTIRVNGKMESYNDQLFWAGISIFPYLPSTAFPVGLSNDNLPIGIQAIGPYLHDLETIRFAELMESTYGGFRFPSNLP